MDVSGLVLTVNENQIKPAKSTVVSLFRTAVAKLKSFVPTGAGNDLCFA